MKHLKAVNYIHANTDGMRSAIYSTLDYSLSIPKEDVKGRRRCELEYSACSCQDYQQL